MKPAEFQRFIESQLSRAEGKPDDAPCATLVGRSFRGLGVRPRIVDQREDGNKVYSLNVEQCRRVLENLKVAADDSLTAPPRLEAGRSSKPKLPPLVDGCCRRDVLSRDRLDRQPGNRHFRPVDVRVLCWRDLGPHCRGPSLGKVRSFARRLRGGEVDGSAH